MIYVDLLEDYTKDEDIHNPTQEELEDIFREEE